MYISESLTIPLAKPEAEHVNAVTTTVSILRKKVIKTPRSYNDSGATPVPLPNLEGRLLTGRKLIVEGQLCPAGRIYCHRRAAARAFCRILCSVFCLYRCALNVTVGGNTVDSLIVDFDVDVCLEDVTACLLDERTILKQVTLLLSAVPVSVNRREAQAIWQLFIIQTTRNTGLITNWLILGDNLHYVGVASAPAVNTALSTASAATNGCSSLFLRSLTFRCRSPLRRESYRSAPVLRLFLNVSSKNADGYGIHGCLRRIHPRRRNSQRRMLASDWPQADHRGSDYAEGDLYGAGRGAIVALCDLYHPILHPSL